MRRRKLTNANLIAVAYDTSELAESALGAVRELGDEHALVLRDAAIVIKHDDGRVELQQIHGLATGEGMVSGGSIGLLLGLALAVPVAGALVGLAGGAGLAALDRGISDDHMRKLGATIASGHAVLFALVEKVDWGKLADGVALGGGELVVSEVADDVLALLGAPPPAVPKRRSRNKRRLAWLQEPNLHAGGALVYETKERLGRLPEKRSARHAERIQRPPVDRYDDARPQHAHGLGRTLRVEMALAEGRAPAPDRHQGDVEGICEPCELGEEIRVAGEVDGRAPANEEPDRRTGPAVHGRRRFDSEPADRPSFSRCDRIDRPTEPAASE